MYEYLDRRYAEALYEVAEEKGKVDEYLEDLRIIVDMFKNDENFIKVINIQELVLLEKENFLLQYLKIKLMTNYYLSY